MAHLYRMEQQEYDEWCWAAVGLSVNQYFSPSSPMKQCELANTVLTSTDCCNTPLPQGRNTSAELQIVLSDLGVLQGTDLPLSSADIYTQIVSNSLPVCVRIGWFGQSSNAHFVVICGCPVTASGEQWLDIADPFYGDSTVPYQDFVHSYLNAGEWTATFLVKQPGTANNQ
jgi:hypothetical protein